MRKENGVWYIEENWFWKYIWGFNSLYFTKIISKIPLAFIRGTEIISEKKSELFPAKNLFSLVLGSLYGIIFTPIAFIIGVSFFLVCLFLLLITIATSGFLGFYINLKGEDLFYPYKYWGNTKIPVALWEICAVLLALYLIATSSIYTIVPVIVVLVIVVLCVIIVVAVAVSLLFDTLTAIWRRIKAGHRRLCPLVVIEPKRQK